MKRLGDLMGIVLIMTLVSLFIISAILTLLLGAQIYNSSVQGLQNNFFSITPTLYIAEKFRQYEYGSLTEISSVNGNTALVFHQKYDDLDYEVWIYEFENTLCELTIKSGSKINPHSGQPIMEVNEFTVNRLNHDLFQIIISGKSGQSSELLLNVRSEAGYEQN